MRTISSAISVFIFGALLASAATVTPLTTYQATTRQDYIAVPPAPSLSPAPYQFYDPNPAFSTTHLLRATDANTAVTPSNNSQQNRSFYTYAGNGNPFGIDDAHFVAHMSGGAFYLFNFDPVHFTSSVAKDSSGNPIVLPFNNANFSYSDPNIIYGTGWGGFSFQQYNISTGQTTQLFDLTTAIQPPSGTYMGDMQVANGYLVADFGGPQQDQHPYCLVYNTSTGAYVLLNFLTNTVYNSATNTTTPIAVNVGGTLYQLSQYSAGVHSIVIEHSGRYVLITIHSTMPGNGFDVWDTQGNTIINALEPAHNDLGYLYSGGGDASYSDSFVLHKLDTADVLKSVQLNPQATGWYFGSHYSWSNSTASVPLAPLFDATLVDDGYFPGQSPWQKELIAACTSCSTFTVWRFANHHCEYNTTDPRTDTFWDQARANVSQDGKYLLFDSNWEYGLGVDPYTNYPRHDLFIVDLASAGAQASQGSITAAVASLSINPSSLTAGSGSTTNLVYLSAAAPSGGTTVTLASSYASVAQVPASITIPAGSSAASFPITTSSVASATNATITASAGGGSSIGSITVNPLQVSKVTLSAPSVAGGSSASGTVYLAFASTSSVTVSLASSNTTAAQVPSPVTIPAGSLSATFSITTSPVASSAQMAITAAVSGTATSASASLTVTAPQLSSVTLNPTTLVSGGNSTTNSVSLTSAAPTGGLPVTLSSSNTAAAQVPATVIVPAGATSASFTITTSAVSSSTQLTITATAGASSTATLTVNPSVVTLSSVTLASGTLSGGASSTANSVVLNSPAPAAGLVVTLSSSNTAAAQVPATVTVPGGATSVPFTITASAVAAPVQLTITATASNSSATAALTVNSVSLSYFTLYPTSISGGITATANYAYLTAASPAAGTTIAFSSSNPSVAAAPATVSVPAGASSVSFSIVTTPVTTTTNVTITASAGGVSKNLSLAVNPPQFSYFTLYPTTISGGNTSTANYAYLTSAAPAGGITVSLTSSNTAAAQVPASVTVPAGSNSAAFSITTSPVASSTPVTITASAGGASQSLSLTVNPPQLSYITLYPTTINSGGTSSANYVYLTSAAPTGGMAVTLQSNNAAVQVPASVIVPAGSTSAAFSIATSAVSSSIQATITASAGVSSSATLTLNPSAVGVSSVTLYPTALTGGNSSSNNTVVLAAPAPAGGAVIALASSNTTVAQVPGSVTVPAGATSAIFTVSTSPVASLAQVTITASASGISAGAALQVSSQPFWYFTLYPTTISGGLTATANYLYLHSNSVAGTTVFLTSSNPAVASVPATVTIPAGSTSAMFSIVTTPVAVSTSVTITASAGGISQSLQLTVNPPQLSYFTLYPTTISGGKTSTANYVYLTSAAPVGGIVVNLKSSNLRIAQVPATVTVPAGATSAMFAIVTTSVNSQNTVTITASTSAASSQVNLTVTK